MSDGVTDTPRTDDESWIDGPIAGSGAELVSADFARQLERELTAMTASRDKWKACAESLAKELRNAGTTACACSSVRAHQVAKEALRAFDELNRSDTTLSPPLSPAQGDVLQRDANRTGESA